MKKWIIALLGLGLVSTATARFNVYQVQVQAKILEVQADRGINIQNRVKFPADKYLKKTGRLAGLLLEDEDTGWWSFILIERGAASQNPASIDCEQWRTNIYKLTNMSGYRYSLQDVGIRVFRLYIDVISMGLQFQAVLCGNYTWSQRETARGITSRYGVNMRGYGYAEEFGECIPVSNIQLRLDSRSSNSLYDAFVAAGGLSNESAGIAAVTAEIREIINKRARIDNSMAVWGP